MGIGVRANIHFGQTVFCPNGERKLFVTRPRQGEKNNNELLQSQFFDGRRDLVAYPMNASLVTLPETYLSKLRGVNQTCIVFCPNNVDSLPELMSTTCPNWGGATAPLTPVPYAYGYGANCPPPFQPDATVKITLI